MAKYITQEFYNFYSNFTQLTKKMTNVDLLNGLIDNNIIVDCGVVIRKNKAYIDFQINNKETKYEINASEILKNDDIDELLIANNILKYIIKNKLLKKKRGKK